MSNLDTRLIEFANGRDSKTILVGDSALVVNNLIYGVPYFTVYTEHKPMNGVDLNGFIFEHYHFNDDYQMVNIQNNIWKPSAEKALLDVIVWYPENMNEGSLIEALQNYQEHNDKSKLYECADHYKVPHEFVDYWWKEAEEESDMSMG